MKPITIMLLTLFAVVLVACSSNQPTSSASVSTAASSAASAAEETSAATEQSATEPSLEAGAGDLAGLLPTEVGGIAIEYESSSGAAVMGSEGLTPEAQQFFEAVGADASDLTLATGFGFDETAGSGISIIAIRVAGSDEGRLRDAFRQTMEDDASQTLTEESVEGKNVLAIGGEDGDVTGYIYVKGDVVFVMGGSPITLIDEALSKLP